MLNVSRVIQGLMLADVITNGYQTTTILLVKTDLPANESTTIAVVTDVANEANFGGYARAVGQNFGPSVWGADGIPTSLAPEQTFTFSGAPDQIVYGYAVVDAAVAVLLGYERFAVPVPLAVVGDSVSFVPRMNFIPPDSSYIPTL